MLPQGVSTLPQPVLMPLCCSCYYAPSGLVHFASACADAFMLLMDFLLFLGMFTVSTFLSASQAFISHHVVAVQRFPALEFVTYANPDHIGITQPLLSLV